MNFTVYSAAFKISYLIAIIPTLLVVVTAFASSKALGGALGQGLKKIASGSIVQTILFALYLILEHGNRGLLSENEVRILFMVGGVFGSLLLVWGYIQIYRIAKKFRLFTP